VSTAIELLTALRDSLGSVYPARIGELSRHTGTVAAVVAPSRCDYEQGAMCTPTPMRLTADVTVVAGSHGEPGVVDLVGHVDAVAVLIRAAGWEPVQWQPESVDDQSAVVIEAVADGDG